MAISVNIPEEISDYKEKILFGLTTRQLGFGALSLGTAIGTALICTKLLHLPIEISGYIIILCTIPPLALGFVEKDGMPFEQYFSLWWQHYMGQNVLVYDVELMIDDPYFSNQSENIERSLKDAIRNAQKTFRRSRTISRIPECQTFHISTTQSCKAARKRAKAEIKAAQQEYRKAKQSEKATAESRSSAQKFR